MLSAIMLVEFLPNVVTEPIPALIKSGAESNPLQAASEYARTESSRSVTGESTKGRIRQDRSACSCGYINRKFCGSSHAVVVDIC